MFPEFEFVNHSFGEFITKSLYLLFFKVSYYFLQHSMFKIIRYVVIVFALSLMPAILSKKRLWHRCFPVNFVKFLRTPFLQNTPGRLLLEFSAMSNRNSFDVGA